MVYQHRENQTISYLIENLQRTINLLFQNQQRKESHQQFQLLSKCIQYINFSKLVHYTKDKNLLTKQERIREFFKV